MIDEVDPKARVPMSRSYIVEDAPIMPDGLRGILQSGMHDVHGEAIRTHHIGMALPLRAMR